MVWLTAWLQRAWHSEIFPHLFAYCSQSCPLPFLAGLFCGITFDGLLYLHILDVCSFVFSLRPLVLSVDFGGLHPWPLLFVVVAEVFLVELYPVLLYLVFKQGGFFFVECFVVVLLILVYYSGTFHASLVDGCATLLGLLVCLGSQEERETIRSSKTDWTAHARLLATNHVWLQGEGWHKSSC